MQYIKSCKLQIILFFLTMYHSSQHHVELIVTMNEPDT